MNHADRKVTDINIAYIGGGSRLWAWRLMSDLALEGSISGTVKLYDIDYEAAQGNERFGNLMTQRADAKGKWQYQAVKTLKEALTGADFVIISILPGTFAEMNSDVHLPERHGIYQSVGDTVGPGGLVRALRTIPSYVEFAENIKAYAPNAWVINYTNPMTLCTRALYEVFPEIKAFGCCHEVFGTQKLLAAMLNDMGIGKASRDEIKTNVLGINHFTWIDQAYWQGMDLFPLYREFAAKYYEEGFRIPGDEAWDETPFRFAHRVKFDLFQRYGVIAAAGDRHLAEFLPPWYLKDPETVRKWKFNLTTVPYRIDRFEKANAQRERIVAGQEEYKLEASGEEGVKQIKALVGLENLVTNVNFPNRGQMKGIPLGAVVETNAYFSDNSVQPVIAGGLPDPIQGLVIRHVHNQETILQAGLKKDFDLALRAFVNDPLVTIGLDDAKRLLEEMLKNTRAYLPGWKLD
jgi:alpha-galactosidase/6-phospho-beta-glucosidase family protein